MTWCALDVLYRAERAHAVAVTFADPLGDRADAVYHAWIEPIAPYQPGFFYRRELPCLEAVLGQLPPAQLEGVIVDGYVDLGLAPDGSRTPGLGRYLYRALGGAVPVIGVAKNRFHKGDALPVLRGESHNPLWVGAAGMPERDAARMIASMHGPWRIPTLLKLVDSNTRLGWPEPEAPGRRLSGDPEPG